VERGRKFQLENDLLGVHKDFVGHVSSTTLSLEPLRATLRDQKLIFDFFDFSTLSHNGAQ
jgi:hypothetical protein